MSCFPQKSKCISVVVESVFQLWLSKTLSFVDEEVIHPSFNVVQSVTSRLETFLNFLRVSVSVSKILVSKKVSVLVSKIFGLEKKSRYRSQKFWSQKSLSNDLKNLF